jgi:hypothetical protein
MTGDPTSPAERLRREALRVLARRWFGRDLSSADAAVRIRDAEGLRAAVGIMAAEWRTAQRAAAPRQRTSPVMPSLHPAGEHGHHALEAHPARPEAMSGEVAVVSGTPIAPGGLRGDRGGAALEARRGGFTGPTRPVPVSKRRARRTRFARLVMVTGGVLGGVGGVAVARMLAVGTRWSETIRGWPGELAVLGVVLIATGLLTGGRGGDSND